MRTRSNERRLLWMNARALKAIAMTLVLPLLLLEVSTARALYRCAYDGVARTACCCPAKVSARSEAPVTVTKPCCCTVERSSLGPEPQARVERSSASEVSASLATPVAPVWLAEPRLASRPFHVRRGLDPPYARPPLILLKSSLLI